MVKLYEVPLLKAKLEMLDLLDKSGLTAAATPLFELSMTNAEESVTADDYDSAAKFLKLAASGATRMKNATIFNAVSIRTKEVDRLKSEFDKLKPELEKLKTNSDDADACDKVGRYLCIFKGDWTTGLSVLVKGKDEKLVPLAKKDLANPDTATAKVELADAWNDYALTLDKAIQTETLMRAHHWYKAAVGELTGLTKTRIEKRVAELDKLVPMRGPGAAIGTVATPVSGTWTVVFRSADPKMWNNDVKAANGFAMKLDKVPDGVRYLKMTEKRNNASVIIEMSKERLGKLSEEKGIGWNGTAKFEWGSCHLGIYDPSWTNIRDGDVCIHVQGILQGIRGWGFGTRHQINDKTGYSWAGKIVMPTVFEIAVKTTDLTADEKKLLVVPMKKK
jgi:hypothetical protein